MDLARLLIVYGPPMAISLTAVTLLWLYYLTRLNRPLIPETLGGWFRLGLLVVFMLLLRQGVMLLNMLVLSIIWLLWFTRKSNAALREPTVKAVDGDKPTAPDRPLVKIICALILLSAAQGFLYEINFHKKRAPEFLVFYDRPLPDLRYIHVDDQSVHAIAELQGKVVLINFWRTDCGSACEGNMEEMDLLYERYKDEGLVVINLSTDDSDSPANILAYLDQNPSPTLHGTLAGIQQSAPLFDRQDTSGIYTSVPVAMVIDRPTNASVVSEPRPCRRQNLGQIHSARWTALAYAIWTNPPKTTGTAPGYDGGRP
jgi:cytochrome oxidase Cu insertion factor (SCO1/SenC/PrrC family)